MDKEHCEYEPIACRKLIEQVARRLNTIVSLPFSGSAKSETSQSVP